MDIAELGYRVDTNSVKKGTLDLDRHGDQAIKTGQQVDQATTGMARGFGRIRAPIRAAGAGIRRFAQGLNSSRNVIGGARGAVQQFGFQVQDVAVQLDAGTRATTVFAQQGSQLLSIFGPYGAIAGAALAITLPLAGAFFASAAGAGEMAKQIEEARKAQASMTQEIRQANFGVSAEELALMDKVKESRREVFQIETQIANARDSRALSDQVQIFEMSLASQREILVAAQEELDTFRRIAAERETMLNGAAEMADQERLLGQQMQDTANQLTHNEAKARLMAQGISASVVEAIRLSGVDMAGGISSAVTEAGKLATNLGIAFDAAMAIQRIGGAGGAAGPDQARSQVQSAYGVGVVGQNGVISITSNIGKNNKPKKGGGGQSAAQKAYNKELQQVESILSSARTAAEKYQDQVEMIEAVYKRKKITTEEYGKALAYVKEQYESTVWDDIEAGIDGVSGALVQAARNGESMGEAIKGSILDIVATIAQSQITEGLLGIAGALLGDSSSGFLKSVGKALGLPSFDGGGHTGSGSRSGGMDGKGGFLAMLHPNETVIDHTKGQGGGTTVVQHMNFSMGVTETVQAEIAKAAPKIRDAAVEATRQQRARTV